MGRSGPRPGGVPSRPAVLVTGGAGYVGSHACKALAAAGYLPVAYDNLVHGHRWAVRWGPLVVGDINDRDTLEQAIGSYRPHGVLHFAAFAYVGESVLDPQRYYQNNVAGTLTLLNAMLRHGVSHLVFSSTCATYGVPARSPIDETQPQSPINPYGASKLMIERILRDYDAAYGLRSIALRYFNAAGADPDGDIGEAHDPETHLIPLAIQTALGLRPELQIFGNDYPTPDGTAIRDYIHVADLADAHVRALEYLQGGNSTAVANLGTGRGSSVSEVISAVERITGRSVRTHPTERRAGDPPELVADAALANAMLSWRPRYPHVDTMVEHAWRWHAAHSARSDRRDQGVQA